MRVTLADVKTAKPPRTVYIAFEGHQVAVRSDAPEVLAGFESIYSAMVVAAATRAVGHLEVSGNGGMYYVRGDTVALDEGSLADVLYQQIGGLRSGMGYLGAPDVETLKENARFIRISNASLRESHPHDVTITKEAPNYGRNY